MSLHGILYLASFIGIWVGAGIAITSVEKLSHKMRVSSFIVSFLILGFFTSISELSVGINAVLADDPGIFVGNLIGASIVLFLLVIPLLAITGNGINIGSQIRGNSLVLPLVAIALPVILSFDGNVSRTDAIVSVSMFLVSAFGINKFKSQAKTLTIIKKFENPSVLTEIIKIIVGTVIIFGSSHIAVEQTEYYSKVLGLSDFLISLMVIGIGTNLPELSLVVRSVFMKNNQVAFGDYLGSAAFNTFIYGILALWYGKPIILTNSYLVSLLVLVIGLILFYLFARSKHTISRLEAFALFILYVLFITVEIIFHLPGNK